MGCSLYEPDGPNLHLGLNIISLRFVKDAGIGLIFFINTLSFSAKASTPAASLNCDLNSIQSSYASALESFVSKEFKKSTQLYQSLLLCPLSTKFRFAVHMGLGRNYQEQALKEDSLKQYTLALMVDRSSHYAYTNRGLILASLGRLKDAINDFNSAIALQNSSYIALTNRGVAYATIGKFSLAIRDFDQALKFNPSFGEAYLNRGIIYELNGELDRACNDWRQAVRLRQFSAKTWVDTQCVR